MSGASEENVMRRVVIASERLTALEQLRVLGKYRAAIHQLEATVGGPLEN